MPRIAPPPHVHIVRARGREYCYYQFRRGTNHEGPRIALPGVPTLPNGDLNADWWYAYRQAAGEPEPAPRAGSFTALRAAYRASPEWAELADTTRRDYERYLTIVNVAWGPLDVRATEPKHVLALRDEYADVPPADPKLYTKDAEEYLDRKAAANGLVRSLSAMLSWGVPRGWRSDNPALHVPKFRGGEGYVAWPWRAIEHYRKHGKPHLWWVAAHALYTGQRQGDVLAMLKGHVRDGEIRVVQEKTGKPLWIPLHRDLRAVQEEMRLHHAAERDRKGERVVSTQLLINSRGGAWSEDGFRASWTSDMSQRIFAPMRKHRLVFHGLRKSAVVCLLESGCTTAEVSAITGQTMEMVEHYAEQVNQRKLARSAILKWERAKP
jgi:hypothetical protein